MPCIEKIYSISVLTGNGMCNAKCKHCAAVDLRKQSLPSTEGTIRNLRAAMRLSRNYGGWAISLTSSGEPSMSPIAVTKTLQEIDSEAKDHGTAFPFINLFTNGILFGDKGYCDKWLPKWKKLGLTAVAVSVHSTKRAEQAKAYGLLPKNYPSLQVIFDNIKAHGLTPRVTLLLGKDNINNAKTYKEAVDDLIDMGVNMITSWPLQTYDGKRFEHTPSRLGMMSIRWWLLRNTERTLGHSWGGTVNSYKGISLRLTNYVSKHKPKNKFIRQLVVFQDGTVAYSWFQKGAFCIK